MARRSPRASTELSWVAQHALDERRAACRAQYPPAARMTTVSSSTRIVEQFREARGDPELAILEGFHTVKHAIRFGAELITLVGTDAEDAEALAAALAPDLKQMLAESLRVVTDGTFSKLAPRAPRTGLIAIARRPAIDTDAIFSPTEPRP